jgi:hypothetical protein
MPRCPSRRTGRCERWPRERRGECGRSWSVGASRRCWERTHEHVPQVLPLLVVKRDGDLGVLVAAAAGDDPVGLYPSADRELRNLPPVDGEPLQQVGREPRFVVLEQHVVLAVGRLDVVDPLDLPLVVPTRLAAPRECFFLEAPLTITGLVGSGCTWRASSALPVIGTNSVGAGPPIRACPLFAQQIQRLLNSARRPARPSARLRQAARPAAAAPFRASR